MIKNILNKYTNCDEVPDKVSRMQEIISNSFGTTVQNLDIDVMDLNSNKIILLQLRSRDDTGGTTAKGSLVDLLRSLLRLNKLPDKKLLYLICIWDERNSQQKNSTGVKICSSLKDYIKNEQEFKESISKGYSLNEKISLKLAYGTKEISDALFEWAETNDESILSAINNIIEIIEKWDDLWIAYSIANLELEINSLKNISNIDILNNKLEKTGFEIDFKNYDSICQSVNQTLNKLLPIWTEDSIPFSSISDKAHYIRDLIFLKVIYSKLELK